LHFPAGVVPMTLVRDDEQYYEDIGNLNNDQAVAQQFVNNVNNVFQHNSGKITQYFNSLPQEQAEIIKSFAQKTNMKIQ